MKYMISIQRCPECSSHELNQDNEKGEVICYNCGLVLDDRLIRIELPTKPEEEGGGLDGVGQPLTDVDASFRLQTNIGSYSDINKLPPKDRRKYHRLRIQQNRVSVAIERNLRFAFPEIKRMCSVLNQSGRIEDEASRIYREIAMKGLTKGRRIEGVAAASVYAACRLYSIPVALKDIERVQGTYEKKEIGKIYRMVARTLNLRPEIQLPQDYLPKICGSLHTSPKVQTTAAEILADCKKTTILSGRSPLSLAAAAVYLGTLIHNEKRTQQLIAKASNITEVSLRNRYKDLLNISGLTPQKIKKLRYKK